MAQEIDALRQRAQETKVRLYRLWLRADAEKPENDALTDACDTIRDLLAALEAQQGDRLDRLTGIDRFEVIDEGGRAYTRRCVSIALGVQDNGRTLKVFIPAPDPPR
jgi:hypothetical protein